MAENFFDHVFGGRMSDGITKAREVDPNAWSYARHEEYAAQVNKPPTLAPEPTDAAPKAGTKHDQGKPAMAYLPPLAMLEVGKAFAAGERKYGPWNYLHGLTIVRCVSGALRHIFQYMAGETYDKETGVHHLACAISNLAIGLENTLRDSEMDNRFKEEGDK